MIRYAVPRAKIVGWFEDYFCGCVSISVATRKKDLLGYCAKHGSQRRHVWPDYK